jgi:glycosyltransferase involved in cell wall biosynthesis
MEGVGAVIATRNRPALAVRAARNALAQTHPLTELVVVDDGSVPRLRLPHDLASDARVDLVRLDRSRGRGAARNVGISVLSTPLVAFLDDDDLWHPRKTAVQVAALRACGPEVAAVGTGFRLWSRPVRVSVPPSEHAMPLALLESFGVCTSTVLARRAALLEAGGFAEHLARCEDWDLWLRLSDRHRIVGLPEILVERDNSPVPASELYEAWRQMRAVIEPRLARLSRRERARVHAAHDFTAGIYSARLGERRAAAGLLLRAWGRDPRRVRRLMHCGRLVVGERLWVRTASIVRPSGEQPEHPLTGQSGGV